MCREPHDAPCHRWLSTGGPHPARAALRDGFGRPSPASLALAGEGRGISACGPPPRLRCAPVGGLLWGDPPPHRPLGSQERGQAPRPATLLATLAGGARSTLGRWAARLALAWMRVLFRRRASCRRGASCRRRASLRRGALFGRRENRARQGEPSVAGRDHRPLSCEPKGRCGGGSPQSHAQRAGRKAGWGPQTPRSSPTTDHFHTAKPQVMPPDRPLSHRKLPGHAA
jgi:hypothetical protein